MKQLTMNKTQRRIGLAVAVLGIVALAAVPANAGTLSWNFSYDFPNSGTEAKGSGTLTTTDVLNGDGSYTITGITGTRTYNSSTDTITGLIAPGGYGGNDNELFPTSPFLDVNGFSFTINNATNNGAGGNRVNVYYSGPFYTEIAGPVGYGAFTASRGSVTPEPSSLILGGTGILALLGCARRRRASC